ncbi:MAG TPA: hypothetical protein VK277_10765 [Acidimicrobiales bacterium]|nr:hypothetical protein [Acidimicrobiales bacterium]
MRYLIILFVVIAAALMLWKVWSKSPQSIRGGQARLLPLIDAHADDPILYRQHVRVKYRVPQTGAWSGKNLGFMELLVRPSSLELNVQLSGAGALTGSRWFFEAAGTHMREATELRTRWRSWIAIAGRQSNEQVELAISANEQTPELWGVLVGIGVVAESPPPAP